MIPEGLIKQYMNYLSMFLAALALGGYFFGSGEHWQLAMTVAFLAWHEALTTQIYLLEGKK